MERITLIFVFVLMLTSCKKDKQSCTTQEAEYNTSLATFTTFDSKTDGGQIGGMVSQHNVPNDEYHWILIPTGTDNNGDPVYNDSVNVWPSSTIGAKWTELNNNKISKQSALADCQN